MTVLHQRDVITDCAHLFDTVSACHMLLYAMRKEKNISWEKSLNWQRQGAKQQQVIGCNIDIAGPNHFTMLYSTKQCLIY